MTVWKLPTCLASTEYKTAEWISGSRSLSKRNKCKRVSIYSDDSGLLQQRWIKIEVLAAMIIKDVKGKTRKNAAFDVFHNVSHLHFLLCKCTNKSVCTKIIRSASGIQQNRHYLMRWQLLITRESESTWNWSKGASTRNKHVE